MKKNALSRAALLLAAAFAGPAAAQTHDAATVEKPPVYGPVDPLAAQAPRATKDDDAQRLAPLANPFEPQKDDCRPRLKPVRVKINCVF